MRRTRKRLSKKDAALAAQEAALLAKWDKVPKFGRTAAPKTQPTLEYRLSAPPGREQRRLPSKVTPGGTTQTVNKQCYTGSAVLGVCVMHKSALVPIFSSKEATDIARMRR